MSTHTHHHKDCSHDHAHSPGGHVHPVVQNLRIALLLNLCFTLIEIVGGLWTNSVAILSDAVHDLGDTLAIAAAVVLERIAHRAADQTHHFGYRRYSTLAALLTTFILIGGSVGIFIESIPRFWAPEAVNAEWMIYLGLLGLLVNGAAVLRLRGGDSMNQKAIRLHLLEDVLGWIAVLIGAVVLYFTDYLWIDPLLSVGVATFILYNAVGNLRGIFRIFLQKTPQHFPQKAFQSAVLAQKDIAGILRLQVWSLDGSAHAADICVEVEASLTATRIQALVQAIQQLAESEYHVTFCTVEISVLKAT